MPNYDYICAKCGNTFEVFQSMNDPRLEVCPDAVCGGTVKRKLGTGAGIIFKGSGFYATDNRSAAYRASAKSDRSGGDAAPAGGAAAPAASSSSCCGGACKHS